MTTIYPDLSVILIVLLVWGLYFILKMFFFDPINQILSARHEAIEGTQLEAKERLAEADKQSKAYAQALKEARIENYKKQEAFRAEAMKERAKVLENNRENAELLLSTARREILVQVNTAKKVLESEVNEIADGITRSVLQ
jgi:F-type H+-transporting ATPase subunit b